MSAKFVVIEGNDGSGTTTQAQMLTNYLCERGARVVQSAQPTKSPIGKEIRRLLAEPIQDQPQMLTCLALLFAADRMQHVHDVIATSIKSSDWIILDRYVLSSYVYQGLHVPLSFIKEINRYALVPDFTIVLDIDAHLSLERLRARASSSDFYETPEFLDEIRKRYISLSAENPGDTVVIDARGSMQEVHDAIVQMLRMRKLLS